MSVAFYFDHHVNFDIVKGLRKQAVDCLTAEEDNRAGLNDEALLARATHLRRVMVSADRDMLAITNAWLAAGQVFHGLIRMRLNAMSIGEAISELLLIAGATDAEEWLNQVKYLPL